jgi:hypothetical protein
MNDDEPAGQIAKYFTYEEFGFIYVMFDMRRFLMARKVENDDGTVKYLRSKFVMYEDKHKEEGATRYVISPVLYVGLSFKVRDFFKNYPHPTYALHSQVYDDGLASNFLMMPPPRPPSTAPPQYRNHDLDGYDWASKLSPEKYEEFLERIGGLVNTHYLIQD